MTDGEKWRADPSNHSFALLPEAPTIAVVTCRRTPYNRRIAEREWGRLTQARSAYTGNSRRPTRVVDSVLRHAAEAPHDLALESVEARLTYGQLASRGHAWARTLAPRLRHHDDIVGVLWPRGIEIPVVQLAAWIAGAAYLPLDPALPDGRLESICELADCKVVATTPALVERLPRGVEAVVEPVDNGPSSRRASASQVAYVIFTSGSTGEPRGVEVTHDSLSVLAADYASVFGLGSGTRVGMLANVGFDCAILDNWCTLASGGTVVVPDVDGLWSPADLVRFLDDRAIDHTFVGTGRLESLLLSGLAPLQTASIVTAGEVLRVWPPDGFPTAVINAYGPTETTVIVTATSDLRQYDDRTRLPPIGAPLKNADILLRSASGPHVLEAGSDGNVVIRGAYLARGYRLRPDLTEAAFKVCDGVREYDTGDICHWDCSGELEFVGRRDRQVKIRGDRVELAEVEREALRCPQVLQAAAEAVGPPGGRELVMWIAGSAHPDYVASLMAARLPSFMVPSVITPVPELPLTSNGKIDRKALVSRLSFDAPPDLQI